MNDLYTIWCLSRSFTVYKKSKTVSFLLNQLFQSSRVSVCTSCDREIKFWPLNVLNSPSRIDVLTGRGIFPPVSPRNILFWTPLKWTNQITKKYIGTLCVLPIAGSLLWKSFWTGIISKISFRCVMSMWCEGSRGFANLFLRYIIWYSSVPRERGLMK